MDTLTNLFTGFILHCHARHLSPSTISDYSTTLNRFIEYAGPHTTLDHITTHTVQSFLASLPHSKKTILNYHTGLSAFWTFLVKYNYTDTHLLRAINRPKPEKRAIIPFTQAEIKALLYHLHPNHGGRSAETNRQLELRHRAMIFLLLDTGLRVTELISLNITHFSRANACILVFGKGDKERQLFMSPKTTLSLWQYLTVRTDPHPHQPLFITHTGNRLNRDNVRHTLSRIGDNAGVENVYPHRFRHTFAINYLRNGGDVYTLQNILGHATLDMVKTYLMLSQIDTAAAHRRASPVDHWDL